MVYACIKDATIKNVIVVEDLSFIGLIAKDWESIKRIDNLEIVPQIGWTYSAQTDSYSRPESNDNGEE